MLTRESDMMIERKTHVTSGLKKVLLSFPSKPPLLEFLEIAFRHRGISAEMVYPDSNHWIDRHIIHKANKLLHNLRIIPKGKYLFSDHPLAHKNYRSSNLLKKYHDCQPDLVLLIRGPGFNYDVLKDISKCTPMFGWWIEMEGRMEEAFREINLFDWYFFINSTCIDKGTDRGYSHISQMLHAVDVGAFYHMDSTAKEFDICFVGNWSRKRQEYIEALLKITDNIVIYGDKWFKKNIARTEVRRCVRGKYIAGDGLVEVYNKSRIVLNVTNWGADGGSRRSGLNMRILEAPATGSFLLTDGSIDMKKVVAPGKHVAVYEDVNECAKLAKYYLDNASEREAIAGEGYKHVRSRHTYDDIVSRIIDKYTELFIKC